MTNDSLSSNNLRGCTNVAGANSSVGAGSDCAVMHCDHYRAGINNYSVLTVSATGGETNMDSKFLPLDLLQSPVHDSDSHNDNLESKLFSKSMFMEPNLLHSSDPACLYPLPEYLRHSPMLSTAEDVQHHPPNYSQFTDLDYQLALNRTMDLTYSLPHTEFLGAPATLSNAQQLQVASLLTTPIFPSSTSALGKGLYGSTMNTASITAFFSNPWSSISTIGSSVSPVVEKMVNIGTNTWASIPVNRDLFDAQEQTNHLDQHPAATDIFAATSSFNTTQESTATVDLHLPLTDSETPSADNSNGLRLLDHSMTPETMTLELEQRSSTSEASLPLSNEANHVPNSQSTAAFLKSQSSTCILDDPSDTEGGITFYQGFRASHPRLSKPRAKPDQLTSGRGSPTRALLTLGQLMFSSRKQPRNPTPTILSTHSPSSTLIKHTNPKSTTRIPNQPLLPAPNQELRQQQHPSLAVAKSRIPEKARHHSSMLQNITRIFSELLSERDVLISEADELEETRNCLDSELQSVEDQIAQLTTRKQELSESLRSIVQRELRISEMVDSLDERIGTIGDQTIRVEKAIRTIRDDSVLLLERLEADIPANSCMKTLVGHTDSVECVHFESPRALMVSGSADKTVRVWDLTTYGCAAVLTGHTGWIRAVQVRGTTVISGSSDHTLRQWKVNGFHNLNHDSEHETGLPTTSSKDLQLVRASSLRTSFDDHENRDDDDYDGSSRGGCHVHTYEGHTGGITSLMFDDKTLFSGSSDQTIRQWDIQTGKALKVFQVGFGHGSNVDAIDVFETVSQSDYCNEYPNASSHQPAATTLSVPYSALFGQPEFEGWTQIDDAKSTAQPLRSNIYSADFDFYSASVSHTPALTPVAKDTFSGQAFGNVSTSSLTYHGADAWRSTSSSDEYYDITGANTSHVSVQSIHANSGHVASLYFQQHLMASGHGNGTVRLWDLRMNSEKPYQVIHGHSGSVNGVWFDDDQLITGSADRTVKVWDLRNNIQTPSISLCEMRVGGSVTAIACDRTRVIVACGEVGVALLRRNTTGQALLSHCTTLVGHDRPVGAVRVVGDTLVSGAMDQTVRVWRVEI